MKVMMTVPDIQRQYLQPLPLDSCLLQLFQLTGLENIPYHKQKICLLQRFQHRRTMASLQSEEKVDFLLHMLATCDEFKPNYGALAKRLGINTNSNAQRRLKTIVESGDKFVLKSAKNTATKVIEIEIENGGSKGDSTTATHTSKTRKRAKPHTNGDVIMSSPKKRKKNKAREHEELSDEDLIDNENNKQTENHSFE